MDWIELRLPTLGVLFRERFIAGCWYGLFASFSSDIGGTVLKEFDVNTDEAKGGGKLKGKRYGFF